MKKKWSAVLLCVCMVAGGLQMDHAYAMVESKMQANQTDEINFETNICELSFAVDEGSGYFWSCVTENLETCKVEQMGNWAVIEENPVSGFQVSSVCEGTEILDFSYMNEQGTVKKNLTYKVVVDSNGKIECTKMAYYSDDVKNSMKNWDREEVGPIVTFPMESRGAGYVDVADTDIVDFSYFQYLWGDYDCNEVEKDWLKEDTQYILLQPKKAGSTIMNVIYCKGGETDTEYFKTSYKLVVDVELHVTVIPVEYVEPEKDPTVGMITTESFGTTGYMWSYNIADQEIADITEKYEIPYASYGIGGGWTTYYLVKGAKPGTTYIRFTYARDKNSGFSEDYVDVYASELYRIDVDEAKQVTITEISDAELPGNVDLPQVTSSPAVMASCYPDYSMQPDVTVEPTKVPAVSTSPVIQSEVPKPTEFPVLMTETPKVSETTVPYTEEPKETDNATQSPKATATAIPTDTPKITDTPVNMPDTTATVESENNSATVVSNNAITATKSPAETKITVETVKITSSIRQSVKKAVVKWKKLTGVKGYQVVVATDKKFTKNVKKRNVSKTKVVLSSLKKGKKYYVKVRAYSVDETGKKVYGKYSSVKVVKKK